MRAVVLAAGMGSRLSALDVRVPKPMVHLGGRPILESNVELLREAGIVELFVNLHHRPDVVRDHFGDGRRFGVRITWLYEPELLGTGGALDPIRDELAGETFVVVYGDNHFRGRLRNVLVRHATSPAAATVAALWRDDVRQSGELVVEGTRLIELREKPAASRARAGWVNAGIVVAEPSVLPHIPRGRPSDLAGDVIAGALARGVRIQVIPFPGEVLWIDTPHDLARAQARLAGQGW